MRSHVVLLGDSIFDNRAYTAGEPDVVDHLRGILPPSWRATLCAVDGSTAASSTRQLVEVPPDATHLVLSVGGNDAIQNADLLVGAPVRSTAEALALFGERAGRFERDYRALIERVLSMRRDTTICTVYNGNLGGTVAALARIALTIFNDVILRVAFERRLRVIDLRLVCNDPADYSNPIEPSGHGGRKIALAIARSLGAVEGEPGPATVHGG